MNPRLVLGIDAAWTATQPSGVALAGESERGWRLIAVESSYERFRERAEGREPQAPLRGEPPDVEALLLACRRLAGREPDLVAVDMPLSREPIVGRRVSDRAISSAFGARKAATHSPSALRPGALSDELRANFASKGFALSTISGIATPGLIEVYPHAALLALSGDAVRLEYKAAKTTTYWRGELRSTRRDRLLAVWARIVGMLERELTGVTAELPPPSGEMRGRALKCYEDRLDAVVCTYAAMAAVEGRAEPYGDEASAIWVPKFAPTKIPAAKSKT